jgi:hypothetical protein
MKVMGDYLKNKKKELEISKKKAQNEIADESKKPTSSKDRAKAM